LFSTTFYLFIDIGKDRTMADDATTFSFLLVMLVQDEELEEAPIDMNVSQRLSEEELIGKVVRTQMV
jgi:hypothetical protein